MAQPVPQMAGLVLRSPPERSYSLLFSLLGITSAVTEQTKRHGNHGVFWNTSACTEQIDPVFRNAFFFTTISVYAEQTLYRHDNRLSGREQSPLARSKRDLSLRAEDGLGNDLRLRGANCSCRTLDRLSVEKPPPARSEQLI